MTIHLISAVPKGGVGKTTLAANLAHALVRRGYRVLLADTDKQGQCATGLGMEARPSMSRWLGPAIFGAPMPVSSQVQETRIVGLDLISGNGETERAQKMIDSSELAPDWMKRLVAGDSSFGLYDYVVWDTPTYGTLVRQALALADVVVIPTALALFGLEGTANFYALATAANLNAQIVILPTRHKTRQRVSDAALDELVSQLGRAMLHLGTGEEGEEGEANPRFYDGQAWLVIPERTAIEQAQAEGLTIFEYAPESDAARAYQFLADNIINSTGEVPIEHGESVRANAYSGSR